MRKHNFSRRQLLQSSAVGTIAAAILASCQQAHPATTSSGANQGAAATAGTQQPEKSASKSEVNPSGGAPTPLTFATWFTVGTDPIVPLFSAFEQQHNVKIKYEVIPRAQIMTKFTALFAAGTAPDVQNGDNYSWSKFYDAGDILDITSYLKSDKIDLRNDYSLIGSEIWCGKTYGMPFQLGSRAVYYNKTLLHGAGLPDPWTDLKGKWSLDDMIKIAQALTKPAASKSQLGQWGIDMTYDGIPEVMGMFIWTFGGKWADFQTMRYTLDSKESIDAHEYVYDWVMNKKAVITTQDAKDMNQLGVSNPFTGGKAALWVRASASTPQVIKEVGDHFEWDVAPWPGVTRDKPGVSLVSGNPHTAYAKTKYPDQAYAFLAFLGGDTVQKFFAENKYQLPALRKYQDEYAKDPKDHRHINAFTDILKVPYGIHFRHYNCVEVYDQYSDTIDQVYLQKKSIPETLKTFNAKANTEVTYGKCMPYKGWTVPLQP